MVKYSHLKTVQHIVVGPAVPFYTHPAYMKDNPGNYPVPTCIGETHIDVDAYCFGFIVTDADETFDPRLCITVHRDTGEVFTDYPHDSPNYR